MDTFDIMKLKYAGILSCSRYIPASTERSLGFEYVYKPDFWCIYLHPTIRHLQHCR